MPTLTDDQIKDLIQGTLKHLDRMNWTSLQFAFTNYEMWGSWMKKDKVQLQGGTSIQTNIMLKHSGAAHMTGLYGTDNVNVDDVMTTADVPWRHITTNYTIERREIAMNTGDVAKTILKLIKLRRVDAISSKVELMEEQAWGLPSGPSDKLNIFGVPYWVVSSQTKGFEGANPSGFSDVAGVDASTQTNWRNYTDTYTNITKDDLVTAMREGSLRTNFRSPIEHSDYRNGKSSRYRIYCGLEAYMGFERLGEAQNENLGRDVVSMAGQIVFKGNPIVYVPKLDADSTKPVYMIDMGHFYPVFLSGEYLRETDVRPVPGQHSAFAVHVDTTLNVICRNRRAQSVYVLKT